MNRKRFLSVQVLFLCLFFSCSDNDFVDDLSVSDQAKIETTKLSVKQAEAYATMFSVLFDENETPDLLTRATTRSVKEVSDIDYFIENGDTLLFVFNYKDNGGYILIGGDNSAFPILSHAKQGHIDFDKIDPESPFSMFLANAKERVKKSLKNPEAAKSEYYEEWKDLGKEGYDFEIVPTNDEPPFAATRGRRESSSGKASIYPYTGKELDYWCQKGGYNFYAQNKACIGCPAISVGMLLYDCSERMLGSSTSTTPSFYYYDKYDIASTTTGTETARKLRQIADSIPNYNWGAEKDAESGATPGDILTGLHKIGFKNAALESYNFETLYKNLSFKGYNYFGEETTYNRGVLIGAYLPYPYVGGHIWFCDGYYEQSYQCKKKLLGITIKTWTEYDDRLYMNWGWGPNQGNGWYCATDATWTSLENSSINLKTNCLIYTNLSYYENPAWN